VRLKNEKKAGMKEKKRIDGAVAALRRKRIHFERIWLMPSL
jgi:hypothetical protein